MRLTVLALLAAALLPATARAQSADPPAVTTGAARDITASTATLTASVSPDGAPATYLFEYGTTAAYGLATTARPVPDSTRTVEVTATVTELTPETTYHYRVVAVGPGGETRGADATFTTTARPAQTLIPRAYQLRLQTNSPTDPIVRATINARGFATTWYVEYGHTPSFGLRTPDQALPAGAENVPVTATLPGLEPARRVHWRVIATNAAGIKRSGRARFTTQRQPTAVTLARSAATVRWGRGLTVRGQVLGRGIGGITVALQRVAFPFGTPFADVRTAQADAEGRFALDAGPLLVTTRFQVQTRTPVLAQSPVLTAHSRVRVGIAAAPAARRSVVITGRARPAVPNGRAVLQRLQRDGTWRRIRRGRLADLATYSRYRFKAPRLRRPRVYRVTVMPRDGGAHVRGTSGAVTVPARRSAATVRRGDR